MIVVLSSCVSSVSLEQVTNTSIVDYSIFAQNGLFATESNSVNFDYETGKMIEFHD